MSGGWICLYRVFQEWQWYKDVETSHLFVNLLLNANHKAGEWRGEKIERGQQITSLDSLVERTGLSKQTVRTSLKRLEKTGEIIKVSNTRFSKITICNYNKYQDISDESNTLSNTQVTHDQHTANTPLTLNNNVTKKQCHKETNKKNKALSGEDLKVFEDYWKKIRPMMKKSRQDKAASKIKWNICIKAGIKPEHIYAWYIDLYGDCEIQYVGAFDRYCKLENVKDWIEQNKENVLTEEEKADRAAKMKAELDAKYGLRGA